MAHALPDQPWEPRAVPLRVLWLLLGATATALGIAGIFLPLLPTTPFLLLAVFAFARSFPQLGDWILAHPRLGPPVRDWQTHRAIGRGAKIAAVCAMAAALGLSILADLPLWLVILQAAVMVLVACFILTRPDAPRRRAGDRQRP